ncbi:MAG: AAA family ATPase, partial [Planctomycetota bacterium]
MIRRTLHERAEALAGRFPVVTITGPRQSGKTTLCRMAFPDKPYANLELPDLRDFALSDPRGFLAAYPDGAVLDEIQRAPDLLSYIQDRVDRRKRRGEFILTGSQHFGLLQTLSQS